MAGPRQPIELVIANGKKHLTKEEIATRRAQEVKPCTDEIVAPSFLTAKQKRQFDTIAGQLQKIGIFGETDCDTLARYLTAQDLYVLTVKDLRSLQKQRPKNVDAEELLTWATMLDTLDKRCDRYFKQAQTAAAALGLTISSRCKLQVPVAEEEPKVNKFARFGKAAGDE
jgi:P27 family predicted phage terminase small subunit